MIFTIGPREALQAHRTKTTDGISNLIMRHSWKQGKSDCAFSELPRVPKAVGPLLPKRTEIWNAGVVHTRLNAGLTQGADGFVPYFIRRGKDNHQMAGRVFDRIRKGHHPPGERLQAIAILRE
jgi:hypothetical protein